jgi:hypothetical protein
MLPRKHTKHTLPRKHSKYTRPWCAECAASEEPTKTVCCRLVAVLLTHMELLVLDTKAHKGGLLCRGGGGTMLCSALGALGLPSSFFCPGPAVFLV